MSEGSSNHWMRPRRLTGSVSLLLALVGIALAGCWVPPDYSRRSVAPPVDDRRMQANDLLSRALAARKAADAAVGLDGSEKAVQVYRGIGGCQRPDCVALAEAAKMDSPVGAMAGLAQYLTNPLMRVVYPPFYAPGQRPAAGVLPQNLDPVLAQADNVAGAERAVKEATEEAQKVAANHNEQAAKQASEESAAALSMAACTKDPAACKARCSSGKDPMSCYAWANQLLGAKKLVDGKMALQLSCDGGVATACNIIPEIDRQIRQVAANVDRLWDDVSQVGDEVARRSYEIEKSVRMGRTQRELRVALTVNAAVVTEKFCPAKKSFVGGSTGAEFQRRAAKHCKEDAPVGQGISGADVPLPNQCVQAYASSCP